VVPEKKSRSSKPPEDHHGSSSPSIPIAWRPVVSMLIGGRVNGERRRPLGAAADSRALSTAPTGPRRCHCFNWASFFLFSSAAIASSSSVGAASREAPGPYSLLFLLSLAPPPSLLFRMRGVGMRLMPRTPAACGEL